MKVYSNVYNSTKSIVEG